MKRIYCYKDGTTSEEYDSSKTLHREDGPAWIEYNESGSIWRESYYMEGECHREGLPADIGYYEDGALESEEYYIEGERHREDGPAVIKYNNDGSVWYEIYCIEGGELSKENHIDLMKEVGEMCSTLKLLDDMAWVRKLGKKEERV